MEAMENIPEISEQFEEAQWELNRANSRQEYEERIVHFEEIKTRYDAVMEQERVSKEVYERLGEEVPGLREAMNNAKEARLEQAKFIKDNANVCVENYRPKYGPPELPTVPDDPTKTCKKSEIEW